MSDSPRQSVSNKTSIEKALEINLDPNKYGTIVEIGAGQEVARNFFRAGAAAGTIAKTMSAYDMQFSDAIYGVQPGGRYVSRARVFAMMEKEFGLVVDRVSATRPKNSRFFAYAATVAAKSYGRDNECHAWCGVRIQMYPGAEPSDIIVHVRMHEKTADEQQISLGTLGVNLIYGAYYFAEEPKKLINSLHENITPDSLEIDSIEFFGPYFEEIDNRAINFHLIRSWHTRAIMFKPDGQIAVPSEFLYKKNVLAIRGSFKPITKINIDMIEQGLEAFTQKAHVSCDNTIALAEITLNDNMGKDKGIRESDILERISLINAMGYSVMISDYVRYFSLREYFRQYTQLQIGIALGIRNIREIFDEDFYRGVEGGILEGFGKLFPDKTKLYVYPEKIDDELTTYENIAVPSHLRHLYQHLLENHFIEGITCSDETLFDIDSRDVLRDISAGKDEWQTKLPEAVADMIMAQRFLGYKPKRS